MRISISDPGRPARLFQLDALRGIGALVVVLYHLTILWSAEVRPTSPAVCFVLRHIGSFGTEAIMFFFLLSGFVLSLSAIEGRPQAWFGFAVRRVFRIYVPYLAALAVAVAGAYWLHGTVTESTWFHAFWSEPVDWRLVGQHLLFVGAYNTDQFDCPIWSLVQEMRICLIFPALCWLVLRFKSRWSFAIAGGLTGAALILNKAQILVEWRAHETFEIAGLFVFGIFLARKRERLGWWYRRAPLWAKYAAGLASVGCFLFTGTRLVQVNGHLFGRTSLDVSQWITSIGAGGIVIVSLNSAWCRKALASAPMQFLAKISYSLYLWHFIVLLYCVHLLYGQMPFSAILGLAFVLMVPVAWLSSRWIEQPANALGRRLAGIEWARPELVQTLGLGDRRRVHIPSIDRASEGQGGVPGRDAVADNPAA
jgi:peptidoglycan/LPS O-acetylase OafA/YrhL